jgi:hypothetical protein
MFCEKVFEKYFLIYQMNSQQQIYYSYVTHCNFFPKQIIQCYVYMGSSTDWTRDIQKNPILWTIMKVEKWSILCLAM